jgi:hypothetical protein
MDEVTDAKPAARTAGPHARISARVPYPDGRGGFIPYSFIEFGVYEQELTASFDTAAAAQMLAWFHEVVITHYEHTTDLRRRRDAQRETTQKAGRPAAALVPEDVDF